MVSVDDDVQVYIEADAPLLNGNPSSTITDAPMIVGFDHGEGRVVYSSFHQEPGIGQQQVHRPWPGAAARRELPHPGGVAIAAGGAR